MTHNIKIPNFWSQEYRMSGINCAVLNRLSVAVGTDNVAGGRAIAFSAYDPATRVLTIAGAAGMIGRALFLYTTPEVMPRRLAVAAVDPVAQTATLVSDPSFSADELAAVAQWRGAVPDILVEESSFVCGDDNFSVGPYGFASGRRSLAAGFAAHAEGAGCRAIGNHAFAFGLDADAIGDSAIAIGRAVKAAAPGAVLIGNDGELTDTPENAGAVAIANHGLLVIVRKTAAGVELIVNGIVRAAGITDLSGNPVGGSGTVISVTDVAAAPIPVFPDEYYLIRREWYAVGCLRTDSYVESGDPENPMPELVSAFSQPRCLPYLVEYEPVKNATGYPIEIVPGQMAVSPPAWNGNYMHISTIVRAGAGAIINTVHSSVNNYGTKMLTEKFPALYHDYGEETYVTGCYIKKTVGESVFIIDTADRLRLLAADPADPVAGEVHLFPPDLVTGYEMALAYWTAHYTDLGNSCPAYKIMEA